MSTFENPRGRRAPAALALAAAVQLALVAAGPADGGRTRAAPLVAFLMPEQVTPRWEAFDRPAFARTLRKLRPGVRIHVVNADNDPTRQEAQARAEIAAGAKVLVVAAADAGAFSRVAAQAVSRGVKVVAYDRLVRGARISAVVAFDDVAVGAAQGKWLAAHTKKGSRITLINGARTDESAHRFSTGYRRALDPLFRTGLRKRVGPAGGTYTPHWDPKTAEQEMERLLAASHDGIDAVISANDGMAGGVIAALRARGLAGKVPVTGQDASLQGVQNILLGTQGMSVFKDFRLEAPAAARATAALLAGRRIPGVTKRVDNGAARIPAIVLRAEAIDATNLPTLVKNGYVRAVLGGLATVCKDMPPRNICK